MNRQERRRVAKSGTGRIASLLATGFAHYQRGDLKNAEACFRSALAEAPDDPDASRLLGEVLIDLGRSGEAISLLQRQMARDPKSALAAYALGTAYRRSGRNGEAISSYQAALAAQPNFDAALHGLGLALRSAERETEALECFRLAARARPDWAVAWKDLGLTFAILGDLPMAQAALQRAVALQPGLGDAQRHLAALRNDAADQAELIRLKAACDDPSTNPGERIEMLFALGRLSDKAGLFADAFENFSTANSLLRAEQAKAGHGFDRAGLAGIVDALTAAFSPEFFHDHAGWGEPSESPVFIVGMPRAGSSLIEQIAASHSKVFGAGERHDIGDITKGIGGIPNPAWTRQTIAGAARRYLAASRGGAKTARVVIDKMPDNILALGLIATLFPNARVIFCSRDPRAVALSCFFQNFAQPYGFDTDLQDCAFRIREMDRLRVHWETVLPVRHITMSYERLVADPEGESRRLIVFLGLEWESNCLEFHLNLRPVRTASYAQVRRPLYRDAVEHWRHYERFLSGLEF
jgi:tetratricopeptide (TPR) repeat protein